MNERSPQRILKELPSQDVPFEEMLKGVACAGCLNRACLERDENVGYCSERKPQLRTIRRNVRS
jgi:hypothetical protein